jgi:hypothetical protein
MTQISGRISNTRTGGVVQQALTGRTQGKRRAKKTGPTLARRRNCTTPTAFALTVASRERLGDSDARQNACRFGTGLARIPANPVPNNSDSNSNTPTTPSPALLGGARG